MDIVLFTPRVWNSTWGQEKNLVEELAGQHRITIIDLIDYAHRYASTLQGKTYPVPEGVTILKRRTGLNAGVWFGLYSEWRNFWDLLNVMRHNSCDVLITYLTAGTIMATILAKCLRKKVLLIYADDYAEFFREKSSPVAWFTKHIGTPIVARCADAVVTTAHKLREDIAPFNSRSMVIPNGVHIKTLQQVKEQASRQKQESFTVGFIGGFGAWVDFDLVLAAAQALPDMQFKLIGSGDQYDAVCTRAQSLSNVWVPGILPYEQMLQELLTMDVCLIPFKRNRITDRVSPIKLFEYWAMEKPVISTKFYEIQHIAADKVWFIENADDLQIALHQLQTQPERCEALAKRGREEVNKYDWSRLGAQYRELLAALSNQGA